MQCHPNTPLRCNFYSLFPPRLHILLSAFPCQGAEAWWGWPGATHMLSRGPVYTLLEGQHARWNAGLSFPSNESLSVRPGLRGVTSQLVSKAVKWPIRRRCVIRLTGLRALSIAQISHPHPMAPSILLVPPIQNMTLTQSMVWICFLQRFSYPWKWRGSDKADPHCALHCQGRRAWFVHSEAGNYGSYRGAGVSWDNESLLPILLSEVRIKTRDSLHHRDRLLWQMRELWTESQNSRIHS